MNIVLIIPTGIGAEIGGHAGDGNPVCKLFASLSGTLVTHPNVVNASDINEMPDNVFYVEGSMLDRFLRGEISLKQPTQNKILVVVNSPCQYSTVNAVSAARVTVGIDASILVLDTPLRLVSKYKNDIATGDVFGWEGLVKQVRSIKYDALAIHTPIEVSMDVILSYYQDGGVNPWGGVEAKASKLIASAIHKPTAHAPLENMSSDDIETCVSICGIADPRMAPEIISSYYLHSVLKGLNRAPRISASGLSVEDIDVMVSPFGCHGEAHTACLENNIPVIVVGENNTVCGDRLHPNFIYVENYWEAAGVVSCMKAGIARESVRRPLEHTSIKMGGLDD